MQPNDQTHRLDVKKVVTMQNKKKRNKKYDDFGLRSPVVQNVSPGLRRKVGWPSAGFAARLADQSYLVG